MGSGAGGMRGWGIVDGIFLSSYFSRDGRFRHTACRCLPVGYNRPWLEKPGAILQGVRMGIFGVLVLDWRLIDGGCLN